MCVQKVTKTYITIHFVIVFIAVLLFICNYSNVSYIIYEDLIKVLFLIFTVLLVHIIKMGRLYLALYGSKVNFASHIKTYCKTTPISIIFPFKSGEFFKMYCYGKLVKNGLKGIIVVLFDRFIDTAALITTIFLVQLFWGGVVTSFIYVLLFFLITVIVIYFVYPDVYRFWKLCLLKANSSENKLAILKILEMVDAVYREIENTSKGRGIILYILSLIAWGIEIGNLVLFNDTFIEGGISQILSNYLISAVKDNSSVQLSQFVFFSIIYLQPSILS